MQTKNKTFPNYVIQGILLKTHLWLHVYVIRKLRHAFTIILLVIDVEFIFEIATLVVQLYNF